MLLGVDSCSPVPKSARLIEELDANKLVNFACSRNDLPPPTDYAHFQSSTVIWTWAGRSGVLSIKVICSMNPVSTFGNVFAEGGKSWPTTLPRATLFSIL